MRNFMRFLLLQVILLSCVIAANGFAPPIAAAVKQSAGHVHMNRRPRATDSTRLHDFPVNTILDISRGGAMELTREGYKLQSMATYSTITALIMNASLRLYTSTKFAKHPITKKTRWCENVFVVSTILCIICGAFTAVLFNVLGIYSKECLGLGNDVGYVAFTTATAIYRKWGFRSFLTTCISFVGSFLLSVNERVYDEVHEDDSRQLGKYIMVGSILLALVAIFRIHTVLRLATEFIYTPAAKAKNHIA